MATKEKQPIDNFNSTVNLTSNAGFQSTLSIDSKDVTGAEPYNPFEHRQVKHPNSTLGSILHIFKLCLGTGILAMPAAFKNSGLVIGVIGTLLAGLICTHSSHMVVKTSQEICVLAKKPSMGYAETCGAAFTYGPKGARRWGGFVKILVDYSMSLTYTSVLCVYVVFIASSFKEVVDAYIPNYDISVRMYCLMTLVPLILICQIRNLKYLVPFSILANFLVIIVYAVTMYYMFVDLPPLNEREAVASVTQLPLFLSTVIFAMVIIGLVLPVENEMAKPQQFLGCPGVLNISMVVVITLYGVFGFFGYVKFGDAIQGSITLNLPQDNWIAQGTKLLMALDIYFSFTLQFYIPMEAINRFLRKRFSNRFENLIQVSIRTLLVIIIVAVAVAFPNLELVISLIGAIFFSILGLLIPAVINTVYLWDKDLGKFNYVVIKNSIIVIISIIALVSGSYASILGIINESRH